MIWKGWKVTAPDGCPVWALAPTRGQATYAAHFTMVKTGYLEPGPIPPQQNFMRGRTVRAPQYDHMNDWSYWWAPVVIPLKFLTPEDAKTMRDWHDKQRM